MQRSATQARFTEGQIPLSLPSILLVDADSELRESRKLLLSSLEKPVMALSMYSEMVGLPPDSNIRLVVVAIGSNELEVAHIAEYARRTWPKARILALGQAFDVLDDPMYDESVMPSCNPAGVIDAARRLLRG